MECSSEPAAGGRGQAFMVFVGGRWHALELSRGELLGRRARFVVWRGGAVRAVKARRALRGLRALAAGRPSRLYLGPPLPRRERARTRRRAPATPPRTDAPVTAAAPAPASVSRSVQTEARIPPPLRRPSFSHSSTAEEAPRRVGAGDTDGAELEVALDEVDLLRGWLSESATTMGFANFDLYRFDAEEAYREQALKYVVPLVRVTRSKDIARMLRRGASTLRYNHSVPHINGDKNTRSNAVTLQQFTSQLGLQSRGSTSPAARSTPTPPENSRSGETQRRFAGAGKRVLRSGAAAPASSSSSGEPLRRPKRAPPAPAPAHSTCRSGAAAPASSSSSGEPLRRLKRAPPAPPAPAPAHPTRRALAAAGVRAYSPLEDHVIVSWLAADEARETMVNGNRVWRELEEKYFRLASVERSWHSLRNRYLRYILPSLGTMQLPQHHAQRLRARAAQGELKARRQRRENSLLWQPAVRSASARRGALARRSSAGSSGSSEPPAPRALRSSGPAPPPPRSPPPAAASTPAPPRRVTRSSGVAPTPTPAPAPAPAATTSTLMCP